MSASNDTIIHSNVLSQNWKTIAINKKEIVSIIEKYNILWNVVTQQDEYINVGR
jgi:hypothetical protein